jgi:hypothetical protein
MARTCAITLLITRANGPWLTITTIKPTAVVVLVVWTVMVSCSKGRKFRIYDRFKLLCNTLDKAFGCCGAQELSIRHSGVHMLHHPLGLPVNLGSKRAQLKRMQHAMLRAQGIRVSSGQQLTTLLSAEMLQGCTHGSSLGVDVVGLSKGAGSRHRLLTQLGGYKTQAANTMA